MNDLQFVLENGESWLQYAVKVNVLGESKNSLKELRKQALSNPKIKAYLTDVSNFHNCLVTNHKNPDLSMHKLLFLLELGFDTDIPEIQAGINKILEHIDENGIYQSPTNIPKHYGGIGEDTFGWCLCDAPLLLLLLHKANVDYDKHIHRGVEHLLSFYKDEGFPCTVSKEHGKFRGPGRKDDCCPYATLLMLKLLSDIENYKQSEIAEKIAQNLLSLWEHSLDKHPYMFYMGTDFRKLKAPAMWYDIVSVADVLSRFDTIKKDKRFLEMAMILKSKQDENGLFTPEAVYQKFKGWDFGQKKQPSPYLTYVCSQILLRTEL